MKKSKKIKKQLDKIYKDKSNQPTEEYMNALRKIQAKAIKSA
jgi:hypothetical protein